MAWVLELEIYSFMPAKSCQRLSTDSARDLSSIKDFGSGKVMSGTTAANASLSASMSRSIGDFLIFLRGAPLVSDLMPYRAPCDIRVAVPFVCIYKV